MKSTINGGKEASDTSSFIGVAKGILSAELPYLKSDGENAKRLRASDEISNMKKGRQGEKEPIGVSKNPLPITSKNINFPSHSSKPKREEIETFLKQFIEPVSGALVSPAINKSKKNKFSVDDQKQAKTQIPFHYSPNQFNPNINNTQMSYDNISKGNSNMLSISMSEEKLGNVSLSEWKNSELGRYKKLRNKLGKLEDVLERDKVGMLQNLQQNKNYSNMSNLVTRNINRSLAFPALVRINLVESIKEQQAEEKKIGKSNEDESLEDSYDLEPFRIRILSTEAAEKSGDDQDSMEKDKKQGPFELGQTKRIKTQLKHSLRYSEDKREVLEIARQINEATKLITEQENKTKDEKIETIHSVYCEGMDSLLYLVGRECTERGILLSNLWNANTMLFQTFLLDNIKQRDKAQRLLSGALDQVRTEERLQLEETKLKLQKSIASHNELEEKFKQSLSVIKALENELGLHKKKLIWARKTTNLIDNNYQEAVKEIISERINESKVSEEDRVAFRIALNQMNHLKRATTQAIDEIDEQSPEKQFWFDKYDNDEDLEAALPEYSGLKQLLLLKRKGTSVLNDNQDDQSPKPKRYNFLFLRDQLVGTEDLVDYKNKETSAYTFEFGKQKATQTDMADLMEQLNDFEINAKPDRLFSPMPGGTHGENRFSYNFDEGNTIINENEGQMTGSMVMIAPGSENPQDRKKKKELKRWDSKEHLREDLKNGIESAKYALTILNLCDVFRKRCEEFHKKLEVISKDAFPNYLEQEEFLSFSQAYETITQDFVSILFERDKERQNLLLEAKIEGAEKSLQVEDHVKKIHDWEKRFEKLVKRYDDLKFKLIDIQHENEDLKQEGSKLKKCIEETSNSNFETSFKELPDQNAARLNTNTDDNAKQDPLSASFKPDFKLQIIKTQMDRANLAETLNKDNLEIIKENITKEPSRSVERESTSFLRGLIPNLQKPTDMVINPNIDSPTRRRSVAPPSNLQSSIMAEIKKSQLQLPLVKKKNAGNHNQSKNKPGGKKDNDFEGESISDALVNPFEEEKTLKFEKPGGKGITDKAAGIFATVDRIFKKKKILKHISGAEASRAIFFLGKIKGNLKPKDDIPLLTAIKIISALYTEILKGGRRRENKNPFYIYVYEFMLIRYGGIRETSENKMSSFFRTCLQYTNISKVRMFLKLSGIIDKEPFEYEPQDFDFYFDLLIELDDPNISSTLGLGFTINFQEKTMAPAERVLEHARKFILSTNELAQVVKLEPFLTILRNEKVKDELQGGRYFIDLDYYAEKIFDCKFSLYDYKYKSIFKALDFEDKDFIGEDSWLMLMRVILGKKHFRRKDLKIFRKAADLYDEDLEKKFISFRRFSETLQTIEGFSLNKIDAFKKNVDDEYENMGFLERDWRVRINFIKLKYIKCGFYTKMVSKCISTIQDYFSCKNRMSPEEVIWVRYRICDSEANYRILDLESDMFIPLEIINLNQIARFVLE